jgi:hypothetical protein
VRIDLDRSRDLLSLVVERRWKKMPCDDITESMRIVLDDADRIITYGLTKKTCGGAIGKESLLIDIIRGQEVARVLGMKEIEILRLQAPGSDVERFLALKHLFGIRSVLEAYTGNGKAAADSTCAIARIDFDGADTVIEAEINISLLTERIKACAHCGPG